ncbi:MAG: S9 family peptidase, partial [Bacteroidetes bacterium HGW-Bacteroidetes-12]
MRIIKLFLFLLLTSSLIAQNKKNVTLEDIWQNYTFSARSVGGFRSMNNGINYTVLERSKEGIDIVKYNYADKTKSEVLVKSSDLMFNNQSFSIDDYEFSSDEQKLLIASEMESIYRHSSKANYYVYDFATKAITQLADGEKIMYATFSPQANQVAFVKENNLFYVDLISGKQTQLTFDGKKNEIINGASDWVYEEELELVRAFEWSPDGKKIAYFRFDETNVKEWSMKMYEDLYPEEIRFKYPKAGEENSKVAVFIYHLQENKTVPTEIIEKYEYISRINWSNDSKNLAIQTLNRHQNKLIIQLTNAENGKGTIIYKEENEKYVEVPKTQFLSTKNQFIITSEKDGYNHLYLYDTNGKLINQLTKGNYDVTDFYGVNEKSGLVYYQSAEISPLDRQVYSIKLDGKSKKQLSTKKGNNSADFSATFDYFINYHSDANTPLFITLNNKNAKQIRVLQDNKPLLDRMNETNLSKKEFFTINVNNVTLNAYTIKPQHFDETKKYPVFMFVYGGPGSQMVEDSWGSSNYFWFQHLASKGYLVVCVDNRGTGARGADFKKITYKQLGKYEIEDQIAAAKYLATLPYIDGSRIGIFGWSYG